MLLKRISTGKGKSWSGSGDGRAAEGILQQLEPLCQPAGRAARWCRVRAWRRWRGSERRDLGSLESQQRGFLVTDRPQDYLEVFRKGERWSSVEDPGYIQGPQTTRESSRRDEGPVKLGAAKGTSEG